MNRSPLGMYPLRANLLISLCIDGFIKYKEAPVAAFSQEDLAALIKACTYARETKPGKRHSFVTRRPTAKRDEALILFLLDTGLRASELCHLKIGEVDMKTGKVTIKHGDEGGAKGGKGRTVFIGKSTRRVVWRYLADREDRNDVDAPIFLNRGEHPFNPNSLRHLIVRLAEKAGEQGMILRFEMQATKGHGRIIPLGSIQRVMRESIEAAAQYIRSHTADLGIASDWNENFDIAVLATMMAMPKEGPSAGVTIVTGIVSALKNQPIRHDIAMSGEITIMGKVLGVGGIQRKLMAAGDAGVKMVILPAENERDVQNLPDYIKNRIHIKYVTDIQQALQIALLAKDDHS